MTREMAQACIDDYAKFDFYLGAQRLQIFCSEDLGGFYLDILKDRLYTTGAASNARRSAQTALHYVTQMLLRLMAPVLSFTAEEAWAVLNPARAGEPPDSVFLHTWNDVLPPQAGEDELAAKWKRIREIRAAVTRRLEEIRTEGGIGSSLQAEAELTVGEADRRLLDSLGDDLRFVLITSKATVRAGSGDGVGVKVIASANTKCERCWHYRADVGIDPRRPGICGRCVSNLDGPGEPRRHA